MTSVEDLDVDQITDLSSILEQRNAERCQMQKDSSNDGDMFADTSRESSQIGSDALVFERDPLAVNDPLEPLTSGTQTAHTNQETRPALCSTIKPTGFGSFIKDHLNNMCSPEQEFFNNYLSKNAGDTSCMRCTICSQQLFLVSPANIRFHPVLAVLICKSCLDFYNSGEFPKDESGYDEYCRWCAEGGSLICCDTCTNVFCKSCLRRCMGRVSLAELKNGGGSWSCLICHPKPLWTLRAISRIVLQSLEETKSNRKPSRKSLQAVRDRGDPLSIDWLPACVAEAEQLAQRCQSFVLKARELLPLDQSAQVNASHSEPTRSKVVECCRQLRRAVSTARSSMVQLDKKIVRNYRRAYGSSADIAVPHDDASGVSPATDSSAKRLVLKIKNFREANLKDDYYAEIRGSPQVRTSRTGNSTGTDVKAEGEHAALKTEPLSDSEASKPVEQQQLKKQKSSSARGMALNGPSSTLRHDAALQAEKANEYARNQLLRNSSSELDSDASLNDLFADSPKKIKKKKGTSKARCPQPLDDDLKLNSECAVVVERIVASNMKNGAENDASYYEGAESKVQTKKSDHALDSLESSDEDDEEEDEPETKPVPMKTRHRVRGKKVTRKTFKLKDLSSTSESESDEALHDKPTVTEGCSEATGAGPTDSAGLDDHNEAIRQALLASSSSDTSDSEAEAPKPFQTKIAPQAAENDAIDTGANGMKVETTESDCEFDADDGAAVDNSDSDREEGDVARENAADEAAESKGVKMSTKLLKMPDLDSDEPSELAADAIKVEPKTKKAEMTEKADEVEKKSKKKAKETKKARRINSDSDFESDSGEGRGAKKRKRKRKAKAKKGRDGSDDSEPDGEDAGDKAEDDPDAEEDAETKPKRRRRIKKQASSSDGEGGSDSDVKVVNESDSPVKNGRKSIKRILKDKSLTDETKAAAKEEDERRRRIADRQRHYNDVFVGDEALMNARIDHLVLDFDATTKKELVTVHPHLAKKLKPHQVKGVQFMWDACFESLERVKEHPGSGCILAHCMGLGKSLQVVTLTHTVLTHPACQVNRVLVVCPLSTVLNWVNEFKIWVDGNVMEELEVYEMSSLKTNDLRMYTLRNWFENGGVMILGYDMFRNLTNDKKKGLKPKMRDVFQRALVDPGPDLVICDEGHLLKNEMTATSKAMNRVHTKRRVVLTGTPLQNSLIEYHCMVQFVKPNLLGNKREFTNRFANPIKNGQCADSTDYDVRVMKRRAHVLHKMLEGSVQRFDYSVLTPFLPPKHEYVISVKMSDLQIKMYQYYLERHAKGGPNASGLSGRGKGSGLFADFQELGRVWTHPKALHISQLRRDLKAITEGHEDSEGSIADFIDDGSGSESDDGGVVCLDDSGDEKNSNEDGADNGGNVWRARTRASRGNQPPPEEELGVTAPLSSTWWSQFVNDDDMVKLEHSGKLILLMDILRQCELIGDKVLVFSQSLVSLDLIEEFLAAEHERFAENRISLPGEDHALGTWTLNADYFRLDGSTSAELRKVWTNHFNSANNLRARLFLISTKAGGLGINLVAANRVIIFDASWNPSHDVQSIFRIYRFGQKKPCYVYRFLAQGTMEEKIYDRQVTKLSLSCRVVDEQQIERHFNSADLNELYLFEPDSHTRRPTPPLPKDRLLAELMIQRKDWIVTFHEHDSLLENKSEEELNEDERKAAWDDFENEKRGPIHNVNIYSGVPGEMAGMAGMAAFAGMAGVGAPGVPEILSSLVGRTVAGIPLNSVAAMILNSNPGITQDEFLGRLRLTVDQLQNFSVQQAAAGNSMMNSGAQQPGDVQRLQMQRQVANDQMKRQFGPQGPAMAGPSGVPPAIQPRSRGRPPIGPHQRTDLYGLAPVIYSSTTPSASGGSSGPVPIQPKPNSSSWPGGQPPARP